MMPVSKVVQKNAHIVQKKGAPGLFFFKAYENMPMSPNMEY